mgnify:CR=1 FL=1
MNNYYVIAALLVFLFAPRKTLAWRWVRGGLFVIDCLVNALILFGDPRETISSRVGKAMLRGVWWIPPFYYLINTLFVLVDGHWTHCDKAIDWNVGDQTIWRW